MISRLVSSERVFVASYYSNHSSTVTCAGMHPANCEGGNHYNTKGMDYGWSEGKNDIVVLPYETKVSLLVPASYQRKWLIKYLA